eukprot:scaffold3906_cov120-Isochrysis_galbana.AAC.2
MPAPDRSHRHSRHGSTPPPRSCRGRAPSEMCHRDSAPVHVRASTGAPRAKKNTNTAPDSAVPTTPPSNVTAARGLGPARESAGACQAPDPRHC